MRTKRKHRPTLDIRPFIARLPVWLRQAAAGVFVEGRPRSVVARECGVDAVQLGSLLASAQRWLRLLLEDSPAAVNGALGRR